MSYQRDRKWSDRFIPEIRRLVGPHLLEEAPLERDMDEVTDLMVLRAKDMRIACRIRRPGFAEKWPWDITLRQKRNNGTKTELAKIVEGWGDWMFYGHAAADDRSVPRWFLIDLHVWRQTYLEHAIAKDLGKRPNQKPLLVSRDNGDGTHLAVFDVRNFPDRLVIAASHPILRSVPKPKPMPAPRPGLNGASGLHR